MAKSVVAVDPLKQALEQAQSARERGALDMAALAHLDAFDLSKEREQLLLAIDCFGAVWGKAAIDLHAPGLGTNPSDAERQRVENARKQAATAEPCEQGAQDCPLAESLDQEGMRHWRAGRRREAGLAWARARMVDNHDHHELAVMPSPGSHGQPVSASRKLAVFADRWGTLQRFDLENGWYAGPLPYQGASPAQSLRMDEWGGTLASGGGWAGRVLGDATIGCGEVPPDAVVAAGVTRKELVCGLGDQVAMGSESKDHFSFFLSSTLRPKPDSELAVPRVRHLFWSPDKTWLAAIGDNDQSPTVVALLDRRGKLKKSLELAERITAAAFSANSKTLVLAEESGAIQGRSVPGGKELFRLEINQRALDVAMTRDGSLELATSSGLQRIPGPQLDAANKVRVEHDYPAKLELFARQPDGVVVERWAGLRGFRVIEASSLATVATLVDPWEPIIDAALTRDATHLAFATGKQVSVLHTASDDLTTIPLRAPAMSLAFDPAGTSLAVLDQSGGVTLWNLATKAVAWGASALPNTNVLEFTSVGGRLLVRVGSNEAYDAITGKRSTLPPDPLRRRLASQLDKSKVDKIVYAPDGRHALATTGSAVRLLEIDGERLTCLGKASSGNRVTGDCRTTVLSSEGAGAAAFSQGGDYVAFVSSRGLEIYEAQSGRVLVEGQRMERSVQRMFWGPDGDRSYAHRALVMLNEGELSLWILPHPPGVLLSRGKLVVDREQRWTYAGALGAAGSEAALPFMSEAEGEFSGGFVWDGLYRKGALYDLLGPHSGKGLEWLEGEPKK